MLGRQSDDALGLRSPDRSAQEQHPLLPLAELDIEAFERALDHSGFVPDFARPGGNVTGFHNSHLNTIANRALINTLAMRHRMPVIYPYRYFAVDGGLMACGPDQIDQWRGAATYINRILRGTEQFAGSDAVKYEFVINLGTTKSLGLNIPASLRARADELIESVPPLGPLGAIAGPDRLPGMTAG
jgi:ABC-type uncharacterized transport system substrate-binding protein